ncbi:ferric reductase like transmembrane component-domain-containing protein [Tricladium varicosporioides]|nr:ferric reductase like transmembrane component-domain-containing protein [Hymenoscyphus varicosporioides]
MILSTLISATILLLTVVQAGGNVGVVGLGRSLFEPLCCYGCLSSLWGQQLPCTEIQPEDSTKRSSAPCHATNIVYLSSLAYCMKSKCAEENVTISITEQCWGNVAGDGLSIKALEDYLPAITPTSQLSYGSLSLKEVSLVNDQYYQDSKQTIQGYVKQESAHALYGTILICAVVGFCLLIRPLQWIANTLISSTYTRSLIDIFRKHLTEPALVGTIHLRKLPGNLGYIPSRLLSLLILCYIALNVVFCTINYPTLNPDTWYTTSSAQHTSFVANRVGVLSFANVAILLIFSGRNTPLLFITNASRSDILTFHRWVGRTATVQAIIHVALYMQGTNKNGENMFTLSAGIHTVNYRESYWLMGEIAAAAMVLMVVIVSALPIRTKAYEIFLFLHILLSIAILATLWHHVVFRFNKVYGYEVWLYISFAFWGFDRVFRILRIIENNWKSLFTSKHPSSLVELLPGDEFIKITVFPSQPWKFSAGQHCFLYFPSLRTNPLQSHPFSIASWSNGQQPRQPEVKQTKSTNSMTIETEATEMDTLPIASPRRSSTDPRQHKSIRPQISFLIRPESGATSHLHKSLLVQSRNSSSKGSKISVFLEGPYGSGASPHFQNANTVVAVAGGIGITSIMSYLQLYLSLQEEKGTLTRFLLVWKVREESLVTAVRSMIDDDASLRSKGVEVTIIRREDEGERINIGDLVRKEIGSGQNMGKKVCVVSCAPGGMADVVRAAVVGCIGMKGTSVELVEEAFTW